MPVIQVVEFSQHGWADTAIAQARARWYCEQLEGGAILSFRQPLIRIPETDQHFLRGVQQAESVFIKNISYELTTDRLRGSATSDAPRVKRILRAYAELSHHVVIDLLSPYASGLRVDYTSFRPLEERGRRLATRARNDLIHIDAFPTRPARGRRILRCFTNIHPSSPRVWQIAETFEQLAERMALAAGLARRAARGNALSSRCKQIVVAAARSVGIPIAYRSPYDRFMLDFHDYLKMHERFQSNARKERIEFPPGSTWIAFTDMVPHAVLSGQYALEQTFFVEVDSMLLPQRSPLRILEALAGCGLV